MTGPLTVEGLVKPEGTLELPGKLTLPPGRVQVTLRPVPESVQPERFRELMERIWADQRAGGHIPRTREEIDAEIDALRNDAEEELQALSVIQLRKQGADG